MRGAAAAALLLLTGGCASSSLTLLPDEGGGAGQVAVLESGGRPQEAVVDRANSRTRLGGGRVAPRPIDRLDPRAQALLADLPQPPVPFTLYFQEGSTRLVPSSAPALESMLAEVARRGEGVEVQVTGHTDREGSEDDNDRLSLNRAQQIRDALVAEGRLPAAITSVVGRGEREPAFPTLDGAEEPRNRRVVVVVR